MKSRAATHMRNVRALKKKTKKRRKRKKKQADKSPATDRSPETPPKKGDQASLDVA